MKRTNIHGIPAPHDGCNNPDICDCDCATCKAAWFNAGRPAPKPGKIPATMSDRHCAILIEMAIRDWLPANPNPTYDDILAWVRRKLSEQ